MEDAVSMYPAFQFRLLTSSSPPIPSTHAHSQAAHSHNINATNNNVHNSSRPHNSHVVPFPNSISIPSRFRHLKQKMKKKPPLANDDSSDDQSGPDGVVCHHNGADTVETSSTPRTRADSTINSTLHSDASGSPTSPRTTVSPRSFLQPQPPLLQNPLLINNNHITPNAQNQDPYGSPVSCDTQVSASPSPGGGVGGPHLKGPNGLPLKPNALCFARSLSLPQDLKMDSTSIKLPQFLAQNVGDYIGLFDGHGGHEASAFAAQHFHRILLDSLNLQHDIESAISHSFITADKILYEHFRKKSNWMDEETKACCGTAVLILLIVKSVIYAANLGDSRAVLCSKGKVKRLTEDHKPLEKEEQTRIKKAGGVVLSNGRVNGLLSVSRAIGDFHLKPFGVSATPSLSSRFITPDDEFIILACDGLWDVISEETAIEVVKIEGKDPYRSSVRLRDMAYLRGSSDNITVIVIVL
eukprot:TRINITY_DN1266_c1_g2_i1.p1 TRINITY_DN1266_c1_g2~~TRINITY_DN1266_c1_g2_i1.p1  ORF type:complete len:531 (+),score=137.07 TRINITY_DN1266_c1_g2_i1:191-1594(+)